MLLTQRPEPSEYGGSIRLETTLWTQGLFLMKKVRNVTAVNTSANSNSKILSLQGVKNVCEASRNLGSVKTTRTRVSSGYAAA